MDISKYILWCSCLIVITIGITAILTQIKLTDLEDSSPVEEMYHRQLVVTLDSILDARFGTGCCEEDTDTVNANTFHTHFGGMLLPMD